MPCTFKASAFLQILFPINFLLQQFLRIEVFLSSKCLILLYLLTVFTYVLPYYLLINLFISLIELKNIHQKHQIKEHSFLYLLT